MAPHTRTQPLAHPVPPSLYRLTRLLLPHYAPTTGKASAPQTLEDLVGLVVNQPAAAAALLTHTPALATMPTVVKLLRLVCPPGHLQHDPRPVPRVIAGRLLLP